MIFCRVGLCVFCFFFSQSIINAAGSLMCHQPAQTLFVAADAAVYLFCLPVFQLVHPIRVCQKLAAHGGALDASAGELLLHKIRVVQTTDTTDGQVGVLPHLIAEFEEASRLAEIGMIGGRDGVFQCGMVCKRYMEAGHTRLLQQRNEHRQFFFHHTGMHATRRQLSRLGLFDETDEAADDDAPPPGANPP